MKFILYALSVFIVILIISPIIFKNNVINERKKIITTKRIEKIKIDNKMIKDLPKPVQRWLVNSNFIGKEKIQTVFLKQEGFMKLKQNQKYWIRSSAEQYFNAEEPAFVWNVSMFYKGIPILGYDTFIEGKGRMNITLFGFIPIIDIENNEKINQSTLQRYLGEIVWFPASVLSPYIKWEEIDEYSAKATMNYKGNVGSGIYYFNKEGEIERFTASRYKDINDAEPTEFSVRIIENRFISGIKIPTRCEVSWILDDGEFVWYKFNISDIRYNCNLYGGK